MDTTNLKNEFFEFRETCIWTRIVDNTYFELYERSNDTKELLSETASTFFHDLNRILIEYCWLQICKITDNKESCGRNNLTIEYINKELDTIGLLSDNIINISNEIKTHRETLIDARNHQISHLDRNTIVNNINEGSHQSILVIEFFNNLQIYCDEVGVSIGCGPLDFSCSSCQGDVLSLIKKLNFYA